MSGVSSLSSSTTDLASLRQQLFAKADTNNDGTLSLAEFVAARPQNVSEAQATALYKKIDTTGSNALTESQLDAGLKANLPQAAQGGGIQGGGGHHHHHKASSSTDDDSDDTTTDTSSLFNSSTDNVSSDTLSALLAAIGVDSTGSNGTTSPTASLLSDDGTDSVDSTTASSSTTAAASTSATSDTTTASDSTTSTSTVAAGGDTSQPDEMQAFLQKLLQAIQAYANNSVNSYAGAVGNATAGVSTSA